MLHLLKQFIALAENHSFTKASQQIHISQPALTKNIKNLEKEFGGPLIKRTNKGCSLTNLGKILYRHAKIIENEMALLYSEIDRARSQEENHITIEYGALWQLLYAAEILLSIEDETQKQIIVSGKKAATTETANEDLLRGECDLFFGKIPQHIDPKLTGTPLLKTQHSIFAHEHHPLFKEKGSSSHFSIENLIQYKWLVFGTKEDINEYDIPEDLKEKVKIQTLHDINGILIIIKILQGSDALILLPKQVGTMLQSYDITEITGHNIDFPFYNTGALFRKDQQDDWLINTVINIAKKVTA